MLNRFDRIFILTGTLFVLLGVVSLLLVRVQLFSLTGVAGISVGLFFPMKFFLFPAELQAEQKQFVFLSAETAVVVGLGLLAVLLYGLFPTFFLDGGRDHGLYLLFSQYIAKTGGLNLAQPWMRDLQTGYGSLFLYKYPGIYNASEWGLSQNCSDLIPQFMHLFPAYGALGGALAGISGVVRTNSVIVFFALWAFYKAGICVMPRWAALVAAVLLAFNPALLWVGRATFTEPLHIFLFFLAFFLLSKAVSANSLHLGFAAGAVLGVTVFNRIPGLLSGVMVMGGALWALLFQVRARRVTAFTLYGYFLTTSLALIDGYFFSFPYLAELWEQGSLQKLLVFHLLVIFGALLLVRFDFRADFLAALRRRLPLLVAGGLIGVGGWVIFRSYYFNSPKFDFAMRSAAELNWYLSRSLIAVSFLAVAQSLRDRNFFVLLTLYSVLLLTLFVYTWQPSISPDHYWASRRWLSFCIPLVLMAAMHALSELSRLCLRRGTPVKAALFLGVLLISLGGYCAAAVDLAEPFFSTSLLAGYPEHYADLAVELKKRNPGGFPYLTENSQAASILTYLYDVPTVLLSAKGHSRLLTGRLEGLPSLGLVSCSRIEVQNIQKFYFSGLYSESVRGRKPVRLESHTQNLIPGITVDPARKGRVVELGALYFPGQVGIRDERRACICSDGRSGMLQFGPYFSLPPGRYRVTWQGRLKESGGKKIWADVDAVVQGGKLRLAAAQVSRETRLQTPNGRDCLVALEFEFERNVTDLEYRFWVKEGVLLELASIKLEFLGKTGSGSLVGGASNAEK